MHAMGAPDAHTSLPGRTLGVTTAGLLVVASMIGTGVFTTTGYLVRDIGSLPAVLVAWGLGGVTALFGALAYGELVAALPHNGGEYQLLGRIYHPAVGFVSGWTSLIVGFSAPVAASAIAFGEYLNAALATDAIPPVASGLALIVGVSLVHAVGVGAGGRIQNALTIGKTVLIVAFIAAGLVAGDFARFTEDTGHPFASALVSPGFAVGLIFVSFAYSGWNAAAYVAGEVRQPERNLPRALAAGTGLVTALYFGINAAFLCAAPAAELAQANERVGHVAAVGLFGPVAGRFLAGLIAIGLVSMVGALAMTGPRVYEAMGRDYPLLKLLATRRGGGGPVYAIALQSSVAAVMALTASFDTLLEFIGFTLSLFAALTVVGVFVLRAREPGLARPYRAWGHPVTSVLFVALMLWMIAHTMIQQPLVSLVGLGTIAAGLALWAGTRTPSPTR